MTDCFMRETDVRVGDVRQPKRGKPFIVTAMNGANTWCMVSDLRFDRERELRTEYVERCRLTMRDQGAPDGTWLYEGLAEFDGHALYLKTRRGHPLAELYAKGLERHAPSLRLAAEQKATIRITITIEPTRKK